MIKNKFGEQVYNNTDFINLIMQNHKIESLIVDYTVTIDNSVLDMPISTRQPADETISLQDYDCCNQKNWYMPDEYKQLDIAEYILNLCNTEEQLQRVGKELLLYQQKGLFDLLRYLKYLVDTMKMHKIIWGVGRGSSVASYVLYLLGVHKIDSIYYDLDPEEFLR